MTEWSLFFDGWIVAIAATCAAACALRLLLVLRRMSLMNTRCAGIAIGFFFTGARSNWIAGIGAIVAGFLTAFLSQWLKRFGKVDEGAAMGVVFTTLFATGLLLIVRGADSVELDPGCVLYGALELAPLDLVTIPLLGGLEVPRAFLMVAAALIMNLLALTMFFKAFRIAAFDAAQAHVQGMRPGAIPVDGDDRRHDGRFVQAVGSIIVVSMIVPAVCARLISSRLV